MKRILLVLALVLLAAHAGAQDVNLTLSDTPSITVEVTLAGDDGFQGFSDVDSYAGTIDSGSAVLRDTSSCPFAGSDRCVEVSLSDAPSASLSFTLDGASPFALEIQQIDLDLAVGVITPGGSRNPILGRERSTITLTTDVFGAKVIEFIHNSTLDETWDVPGSEDGLTTSGSYVIRATNPSAVILGTSGGITYRAILKVTLGALTFD